MSKYTEYEVSYNSPATSRQTHTSVSHREMLACALIMVGGMLLAYAIGLYTGTRFVKSTPPVATVEVASEGQGRNDGK